MPPHKLSAEDNAEIRLLAAGHPHVIVEDQMSNFMVVGTLNGADVTGGTAVTGNAMGDLNGYTLTLTGNERALANFYTGDLETEEVELVKSIENAVEITEYYKKKMDRISLSQFEALTGINRHRCHHLLKGLIEKRVIKIE